jgi:hypothetical protein
MVHAGFRGCPKISNRQPPIANLEHRSAISLAIHCKRMFQIGDRRLLIANVGKRARLFAAIYKDDRSLDARPCPGIPLNPSIPAARKTQEIKAVVQFCR